MCVGPLAVTFDRRSIEDGRARVREQPTVNRAVVGPPEGRVRVSKSSIEPISIVVQPPRSMGDAQLVEPWRKAGLACRP